MHIILIQRAYLYKYKSKIIILNPIKYHLLKQKKSNKDKYNNLKNKPKHLID